jgi:hypothetical protein
MSDSEYAISIQSGYVLMENPPDHEIIWSEEQTKLRALAEVCREAGCHKVPVVGAKAKVHLTTMDIFNLGEEIAKMGIKVAIVEAHDASQDDETFLKIVASNRGSLIQFFDTEADAKDWLGV